MIGWAVVVLWIVALGGLWFDPGGDGIWLLLIISGILLLVIPSDRAHRYDGA